ncbi:hypothetical protein EV356DRAFT_681 [Viridothelium virens]|uniref:Uncharacterized protein n=1 Tax=Viridothelium virens TaxID=1048519 RepID=A0A6A6HNT8_VIRVR|nr:hypothetical protein EV356DRAFT_681 [Viridothelium virens]
MALTPARRTPKPLARLHSPNVDAVAHPKAELLTTTSTMSPTTRQNEAEVALLNVLTLLPASKTNLPTRPRLARQSPRELTRGPGRGARGPGKEGRCFRKEGGEGDRGERGLGCRMGKGEGPPRESATAEVRGEKRARGRPKGSGAR